MCFTSRSLFFIYMLLITILFSCGGESVVTPESDDVTTPITDDGDTDSVDDSDIDSTLFITPESHAEPNDYVWDSADEILVNLEGESISVIGEGVTVSGAILTINAAGTYRLSGYLYDGQLVVDTDDEGVVRLIFDNVDISNSTSAPVTINSAAKTVIILAKGTHNEITDAAEYIFASADEDEPNAALFSKDDLTIYGQGSLTVNANYNDGITSKDGLVIMAANITVQAKDDGIRGKDYLIIEDVDFSINALGDGLKSDNDNENKGYISIASGVFNITAGADAIQAKSNIQIENGEFTLSSGGGSHANISSDDSAKGIKAGINIFINGGEFIIDAADDAIHSNNAITINGGLFEIASADDGIHADIAIEINDGIINISQSYEGIESEIIVLNGGNIHVVASDDGINVAGGNDGSGFTPGGGGNSDYYLQINDGYIVVNAAGDGLDSNGNIEMTGGTIIVNGPTQSMNGPLDYDGSFEISGGLLIAVGSSGMAQGLDSSSTQLWMGVSFSTQQANQLIHVQKTDSKEEIVTFAPAKNYQSFVFSSSALEGGINYDIYMGGSSTGVENDGLFEGGSYTAGELVHTQTTSN